jgi:hypothetical protein
MTAGSEVPAETEPEAGVSPSSETAARPPGQSELDLGIVPTGDERVDQALVLLEQLGGRPVDEHPAVYEAVHQQLQAALVADPGPPGG